MSRRAIAAALAACTVLAGCAQSKPVTSDPTRTATFPGSGGAPTASASPGTCAEVAGALSPQERAGQVVLIGVASLDAADRVAASKPAGVVLTGSFKTGVAGVKAVTDRLRSGTPGAIVAVAQEGGAAQPLSGAGFDTIPAAPEAGKLGQAELRTKWAAWGVQLKDAGVTLNLAPVADVVPAAKASGPLAGRSFGADPNAVATSVTAVVDGLHLAGVGSAVGHFPGQGELTTSTDAGPAVDAVTDAASPGLAPFRAAALAGSDALVVSTATYQKLDPGAPAALSGAVLKAIRNDVRFTGVVASDDLAAKSVAGVPAAQRAVAFVRAGGDLAYFSDPSVAEQAIAGLAAAAESDQGLNGRLSEAAANVLGLKASYGLARCTAAKG